MGDNMEASTQELMEQVKKLEVTENAPVSPRPSMKPTGNTHNNIFGNAPASEKKTGRIYHMTSDIFSVGSIIDRDGHDTRHGETRAEKIQEPEKTVVEIPIVESKEEKSSSSVVSDGPDVDKIARDSGFNPIIEDGQSAAESEQRKPLKSQKRHYQLHSQPLW